MMFHRAVLLSTILALLGAADAESGCYDRTSHVCSCDSTKSSCAADAGVWTTQCDCAAATAGEVPFDSSWCTPTGGTPSRYSCSAYPKNVTANTGSVLELVISAGSDVQDLKTKTAYDACDMTGATELVAMRSKGSQDFKMTFQVPGTYYLSTSKEGACAAGQKLEVIIKGAKKAETNPTSSALIFAPAWHANPGEDDDFTAFGKGIFHEKAYDDDLHTTCEADYCLDREESRGSCYYSGEDFHIGHAIFCDVSEVECCGYQGCSVGDNRGKLVNGTSHGYFYYAPGYKSGGNCCHCFASCDTTSEIHSAATDGQCKYRDVTSKLNDCQRDPDRDSMEKTTIGFLSCAAGTDGKNVEFPSASWNIREKGSTITPEPSASAAEPIAIAPKFGFYTTLVVLTTNLRARNLVPGLAILALMLLQTPTVAAQYSTPSDAELARYLVHKNSYSIVATNSIHLDGHVFSNVASCSDGIGDNSTGRIFFYLTLMDPTGADLKEDPSAAVTFAQAQLTGASSCGMTDPEDPTCAKLTIGGNIVQVQEGADKDFALKALFSRNPAMSDWPAEHGWIVFEMIPEDIIIFSHYGGSARISPLEYFAASPKSPANIIRARQAAVRKSHMASSLSQPASPSMTKPEGARKMIHAANWGVLSTSTKAGKPFSYVESFSDGATGLATGRIWFFLTEKDQVVDDASRDDRVSFTVSQAMIDAARTSQPFCGGNIAEDPTCGRITLSGQLRRLESPAEISTAKAALFARHPVMVSWPGSHAFTPYELEIETIFFVNFYGGASPMTVSEYFAAIPVSENLSENTVTVAK